MKEQALTMRQEFAIRIMQAVTSRDGLSTPEVEQEKCMKAIALADQLISLLASTPVAK